MEFKRIRNLNQYTEYCDLYEELILKDFKKDRDKIDLLELLIEDFDNRTIDQIGISEKMDPVELIVYLLEENNLTKSELSRQLNVSRKLVTEVVNYKKNISKRIVVKLSERFKIRPMAFTQEYELKGYRKKLASV
ncbi:MAG: HTH-type transcriptional regulator/antitoxin HigA [Saprospiraceae bacterium]|jgi:HTH-type transcriptional regulator/antitoxin HigA